MNYALMPVHTNAEMTRAAIESVLAQDIPTHLFVVLNGATDGSQAYVHSLDPHRVTTISYQPQKGVSYAWNRGLEWVFERSDHALVVNNDIELLPSAYRTLLADGGGFVTAVSVNDRIQLTEPCVRGRRPNPDFSCFVIRKHVYNLVGPFDEGYFPAYYEDNDYHVRMYRAGVEACCIDVPFYHAGAGTLNSMTPEDADAMRLFIDGNRQRFFGKYGCYPATVEYDELFRGRVEESQTLAP